MRHESIRLATSREGTLVQALAKKLAANFGKPVPRDQVPTALYGKTRCQRKFRLLVAKNRISVLEILKSPQKHAERRI